MPDRLDHLYRDAAIILPAQVAVIAEQDFNPLAKAGGLDPLFGQLILLPGNGRAGHAATVVSGGMDREAAPAGTDLDHMMLGAQIQFAADQVQLGDRGLVKVVCPGPEHARRIGHALIQKQPEQIVAQIVVILDIPAAAAPGIGPEEMTQPVFERGQAGRPLFQPIHLRAVGDQDAKQGLQAGAGPEPAPVGVGRAVAAMQTQRRVKGGIMHPEPDGQSGRRARIALPANMPFAPVVADGDMPGARRGQFFPYEGAAQIMTGPRRAAGAGLGPHRRDQARRAHGRAASFEPCLGWA